jgi:hypothetical protein
LLAFDRLPDETFPAGFLDALVRKEGNEISHHGAREPCHTRGTLEIDESRPAMARS